MASPSSPQHEPTMEEILASIRKIISEDSSEPAPPPAAAPQATAPAPDPDVLELTHEIHEEPAPAPEPVAAAPAPEPMKPADDVEFQTIEEPHVSVEPEPAGTSSDDLVSEKTRNAVDDALAGLDFDDEEPTPAPVQTKPMAPTSGNSVEAVFDRAIRETFDPVLQSWLHQQADVIVDRMKPAIREWMELHLPDMLKSAVEAEVARAVRNRTKR